MAPHFPTVLPKDSEEFVRGGSVRVADALVKLGRDTQSVRLDGIKRREGRGKSQRGSVKTREVVHSAVIQFKNLRGVCSDMQVIDVGAELHCMGAFSPREIVRPFVPVFSAVFC